MPEKKIISPQNRRSSCSVCWSDSAPADVTCWHCRRHLFNTV